MFFNKSSDTAPWGSFTLYTINMCMKTHSERYNSKFTRHDWPVPRIWSPKKGPQSQSVSFERRKTYRSSRDLPKHSSAIQTHGHSSSKNFLKDIHLRKKWASFPGLIHLIWYETLFSVNQSITNSKSVQDRRRPFGIELGNWNRNVERMVAPGQRCFVGSKHKSRKTWQSSWTVSKEDINVVVESCLVIQR